MKTILIQNGTVYDGLGGPGVKTDLLLAAGKIQKMAPGLTDAADLVIDAAG